MRSDQWEQRLEERRKAREFKRLLERSSLSEDSLWVQCEEHGRQARDPFTDRCVLCPDVPVTPPRHDGEHDND